MMDEQKRQEELQALKRDIFESLRVARNTTSTDSASIPMTSRAASRRAMLLSGIMPVMPLNTLLSILSSGMEAMMPSTTPISSART